MPAFARRALQFLAGSAFVVALSAQTPLTLVSTVWPPFTNPPGHPRFALDLVEAAEDIRTDVMLGHVRRASIGALRTENTHPFRYRA